jgi:hypothetical protein
MVVYYDGTTWQMLLSAEAAGGGPFTTGYYHSTSPTSGWTQYGGNPVLGNTTNQQMAPGSIVKSGSTYYVWLFGGTTTGNLPTDIYTAETTNFTSFTYHNSGNPTYPRTQADEGVATTTGQVANPAVVEANGKTYMFYSAAGDGNGVATGIHIKVAVANYTIANLIATSEGNGGAVNVSTTPPVYDQTQTDNRYIPNAKNVGNYGTWGDGALLLGVDATAYGIRERYESTPTTFNVLLPDYLAFYKSGGVQNEINTGSSGFNFQSYGGIAFSNISGSGASSLGNFDSSGDFTSTATITAGAGGGGFTYSQNARTNTDFTNGIGYALRSGTASSSSNPVYLSPSIYAYGRVWNTTTSSDNFMFMGIQVHPVSGATPYANLEFQQNTNFGSTSTIATLSTLGDFRSTRSLGSTAGTYANRPASPNEGDTYNFTDATVNTWGATISAGSGSNHVAGRWNGSAWTVIGI